MRRADAERLVGTTHPVVLFVRALLGVLGLGLCLLLLYAAAEGRNVRLRDETALGALLVCAVVALFLAAGEGRRRGEILQRLTQDDPGAGPPPLGLNTPDPGRPGAPVPPGG